MFGWSDSQLTCNHMPVCLHAQCSEKEKQHTCTHARTPAHTQVWIAAFTCFRFNCTSRSSDMNRCQLRILMQKTNVGFRLAIVAFLPPACSSGYVADFYQTATTQGSGELRQPSHSYNQLKEEQIIDHNVLLGITKKRIWATKGEMLLWMTSVVRIDVSQLIIMPLSLPRVTGFSPARRRQCLQSTNKVVDKQKRAKTVMIKQEKRCMKNLYGKLKKAVFSMAKYGINIVHTHYKKVSIKFLITSECTHTHTHSILQQNTKYLS